ncbi:MAG: hypothetical protein LC804_07080 [Acidobacteria bacterium]|nr:hypothetical protein [Acidobacteriota bacterium]
MRVFVALDGILAHGRPPHFRRGHLDDDFLRPGEEHLVLDQLDLLEARLGELIAGPFSKDAVTSRARDVRLCREVTVGFANAFCRG